MNQVRSLAVKQIEVLRMAQQKTILERSTFAKGLITEANALTFPENASADELNFTLKRDGSRSRRLGLDHEPTSSNFQSIPSFTAQTSSMRSTTYLWENASGIPGKKALVIQIGSVISIIMDNVNTLNDGTPVGNFSLPKTANQNDIASFASTGDYLVVTHPSLSEPLIISYDEATDTFTQEYAKLEVRDIWGIHEDVPVDDRPWKHTTTVHRYNLQNQGWPVDEIDPDFPNARGAGNDNFPSNADIPWVCVNGEGNWNPNYIKFSTFGTTYAPRGKYIISYKERGKSRGTKSGLSVSDTSDVYNGTPSKCAAFAGRIFYAGLSANGDTEWENKDERSPDYKTSIMFSQVVENKNDISKCYQEYDPTAQDSVGIVATDGGIIHIAGIGDILHMESVGKSLIIFASNGVWELTGDANYGSFRADAFTVSRVTSSGVLGSDSVINLGDSAIYWSDGGIYSLQPNSTGSAFTATNITEATIQSLYVNIPVTSKLTAKGIYDEAGRNIRWLYSSKVITTGAVNTYDTELIFDIVLKAWYKYELPVISGGSEQFFVASYAPTGTFSLEGYAEPLTTLDGTVVTDNDIVPITLEYFSPKEQASNVKYMLIKLGGAGSFGGNFVRYQFGYYWRTDFKDFNEEDAPAHLVTGAEFLGSTMSKKSRARVHIHMERTEKGFTEDEGGNLQAINPSSCLVNAKWDLANSVRSGKIGSQFQGYRLRRPYFASGTSDTFDYGWEVVTSKSTLRGSGKALALRFETEPDKDCRLLGWALEVPQQEDA